MSTVARGGDGIVESDIRCRKKLLGPGTSDEDSQIFGSAREHNSLGFQRQIPGRVELCFCGRVESPWYSGFEQAKALSQIERSSPELSRKLVYCRGY